MAARKKIALTYYYTENWIAGAYYVANLIKALNTLPPEEKPEIKLLVNSENGLHLIRELQYPHISIINADINADGWLSRTTRKLQHRLTGKDDWLQKKLAGVQHIFEGSSDLPFIPNHYYWVHDFQECRLPDFFTAEEAAARSALANKVAKMPEATLIVSSHDALNDFRHYFAGALCKTRVLRFTSSLPDYSSVNMEEQKKLFGIHSPYFICSNQFWQHKNHRVVLNAVAILKEKNLRYQVLFTGKNFDHRNPGYFASLEQFVADNGLGPWVSFLGFIDRNVQLQLADHALSYIQPSLFEGWSTTVEDAKCMNQHIILSNLPVHLEQIDYNVDFFDPHDPAQLAAAMENIIVNGVTRERRDYRKNIEVFGRDILETFAE